MSTSAPSEPPAQPAGWKVTRQDHQPSFDPSDPSAGQWTVYFRTARGTESFIVVSESGYTPENVKDLISEKAARIDQVAGLEG